MENRQLLSIAPIHVGVVYFEDNSGQDQAGGDRFEITWSGGVPGTQLTRLTIDTDKLQNGLDIGDVFFDTSPAGGGAFQSAPWVVVDRTGIDSVQATVEDGGTTLVLDFIGFDAGERLVFTVDVDEMGFLGPNAVAEGNEFEGSRLEASFAAAHYYDAAGSDMFVDFYDAKLAASSLPLPPDSYVPPGATPSPVYTAGAVFSITQTPLPIRISGTVFEDVDLDNVRDPADQGLAGVRLELWRLENGTYGATGNTALTDAAGQYQFENVLPGTYRIAEVQPQGYFSIGAKAGSVAGQTRGAVEGPDAIRDIVLLGGEVCVGNDFAEAKPATLSGHVYHDADNDGTMDPGETGMAGVTLRVQYLPPGGLAPAAVEILTASDGSWSVGNLMPGEYEIVELQPAGYLDGLDSPGTAGGTAHNPGDRIDGIWLSSGQAGARYDFGELVPSTLRGQVIGDTNGNSELDPADLLLSGVTVQLLDASGTVLQTTQTNSQGEYAFTHLAPGVYGVREVQPAEYLDGPDQVGTAGGTLQPPDTIVGVTLVSGTHATRYDFYEILPSSISGRVFADRNGDCRLDPGEPRLPGVTLRLRDSEGNLVATTQTDAQGQYEFAGLAPGVYTAEEVQPAGYFDACESVGTAGGEPVPPDSIAGIRLISGTVAQRYDFAEKEPASLSGYVYADDNDNGLRDPGEAGIAGVTVMLLDAVGGPTGAWAVTNAHGFYRFTDLRPGVYGVAEVQPDGYHDGLDAPGTAGGTAENPGDLITGAELLPNVHAEEYNFGELRPASLTGMVYADRNDNGLYDPGDQPLAGVTVYLLDGADQRIAATTTGADGRYQFGNLLPGTYGLEEIQPAGYFDGKDRVGTAGGELVGSDTVALIDLLAGMDATDYDFGEIAAAKISGYVFQDGATIHYRKGAALPDPYTLRDGQWTSDDRPLAGVWLQLGDEVGAPVLDDQGQPRLAVTDANGYYEFAQLPPGTYTIFEYQPEGYLDGNDTAGSHGGIALNPSLSTGQTESILDVVAIKTVSDAIVFVPIGPGDEAVAYNFSEVRVQEDEPPPEPPPVIPPDRPEWPGPLPHLLPAPYAADRMPGTTLYGLAPDLAVFLPLFGGGVMLPPAHTWHLSVLNAGRPRRDVDGSEPAAYVPASLSSSLWAGANLVSGTWTLADGNGQPIRTVPFGLHDGTPVAGDFNGDGVTELGVFRGGTWYLDLNGNGRWDEHDLWAKLGRVGDRPVVGDWDGDGKSDLGTFGPEWPGDPRALAHEPGLPDVANKRAHHLAGRFKNIPPDPDQATSGFRTLKRTALGKLRKDLIDHVFQYGGERDQPVSGDWNGDGVSNIGVFRDGLWYLDLDGDGRWSAADDVVEYGRQGDVPVVGDWTGDGTDKLGVYRQGEWHLDTNGDRILDARDKVFRLGGATDVPVVGDWNGDGIDEVGIYQPGPAPAEGQAPLVVPDAPDAAAEP